MKGILKGILSGGNSEICGEWPLTQAAVVRSASEAGIASCCARGVLCRLRSELSEALKSLENTEDVSSNGTFVNETQVPKGFSLPQRVLLRDGDHIYLAQRGSAIKTLFRKP